VSRRVRRQPAKRQNRRITFDWSFMINENVASVASDVNYGRSYSVVVSMSVMVV